MGDEWSIAFYLDQHGHSPIAEFLDSLDVRTRARFRWSLEQLRVRNVQARYPLVRHLEGDLWELREQSQTNIYRIIYVVMRQHRIVLLHGFQKKTQKTPQREINTALRRYRDLVEREQRGDP